MKSPDIPVYNYLKQIIFLEIERVTNYIIMKVTIEQFCELTGITKEQFTGKEEVNDDLDLRGFKYIPEGFNPQVKGSLWMDNVVELPEGFSPTVGEGLFLNNLTTLPEGFNLTIGGDLDLDSLTMLPEGFNPTVGGSLYLSSLTTIPTGFCPKIGYNLSLDNVRELPEDFAPNVPGNLYLHKITTLPKGFNPTVDGCLYLGITTIPEGFNPNARSLNLNAVTSIPEGFNLVVKENLNMQSLKTVPRNFCPIVGGSLDLHACTTISEGFNPIVGGQLLLGLTELPDNFNLKVGGSLYLDNLTTLPPNFSPIVGDCLSLDSITSVPDDFNPQMKMLSLGCYRSPSCGVMLSLRGNLSEDDGMTWQDGKYILTDGLLTEVITKRSNIYKVKKLKEDKEIYLVTDGKKYWAHGDTLKEAKEDLFFKMCERNKSDYEDLTPETELTLEEAIIAYRSITGACAFGTRDFIKNKLTVKKDVYTVAEIIQLTKNEYGESSFIDFIYRNRKQMAENEKID